MKEGSVSGVLLAGGKSLRMGRDKRLLEIGGMPLFSRVLGVLDELFDEVLVSVAETAEGLPPGHYRVVPDLMLGCATLGGLYSALQASQTEWICAVACDMPLIDPQLVRYLIGMRGAHDYVMPMLSTGPQPMLACYRKTCLTSLHQRLEKKDLRLQGLLEDGSLRGRLVLELELMRIDPQLRSFLNINTPADLEMVRKLLGASPRNG